MELNKPIFFPNTLQLGKSSICVNILEGLQIVRFNKKIVSSKDHSQLQTRVKTYPLLQTKTA